MPARKMNVGAQKCVTHRVRNKAVSAKSRGLTPPAPKKSRVWSSAISTMTSPRNRSMLSRRLRAPAWNRFFEAAMRVHDPVSVPHRCATVILSSSKVDRQVVDDLCDREMRGDREFAHLEALVI